MTAIGFLLMFIGFIIIGRWGNSFNEGKGDYIGGGVFLLGLISAAVGVFKFLWIHMP